MQRVPKTTATVLRLSQKTDRLGFPAQYPGTLPNAPLKGAPDAAASYSIMPKIDFDG